MPYHISWGTNDPIYKIALVPSYLLSTINTQPLFLQLEGTPGNEPGTSRSSYNAMERMESKNWLVGLDRILVEIGIAMV